MTTENENLESIVESLEATPNELSKSDDIPAFVEERIQDAERSDEKHVPSWRLREEAAKRRAAEKRVEELEVRVKELELGRIKSCACQAGGLTQYA